MAEYEPLKFYLDLKRGRAVTSDDPEFSVSFGGRSKVTYEDPQGTVWMGANYGPSAIEVSTRSLSNQLAGLNQDELSARVELVKRRIQATAAWRHKEVIFVGPWADSLPIEDQPLER